MVPARTLSALLLAVLALSGCKREAEADPALEAREQAAFDAQQQDWHAQRLAELAKPDGWTSLIGLHWLDPGPHRVGSAGDNGIRLAMGPEKFGVFTVREGKVTLAPEPGVALTIDDEPVAGVVELRDDTMQGGPARIGFDDGKGLATVIARAGRLALRVKHAEADTRVHFAGLDYWPGGRDWRVVGRFVPHEAGKTIPIANIIGSIDEMPNPGAVEFQRDGKTFRLEALDEGDGELFLVFADRTSGHGSYPAGRFLYAPPPDAEGRVTLDFNQAFNPPCAFTPFATCPLPPPENRLDLAVEAGEKTYGTHVLP